MEFILTCCGKKDPIGIDREHLILSFKTDGSREILSYEIGVSVSREALEQGRYDVGIFPGATDGNHTVWLEPEFFRERTGYYWRVFARTAEGDCQSPAAFFETGINQWSAEWIGGFVSDGTILNFKKEFEGGEGIQRARVYICGLGFFNASINDVVLGEDFFKPLVTDYSVRHHPENAHLYENRGHRVTYYTYDITPYLNRGTNRLLVDVANGYYCNTEQAVAENDFSFGEPKLAFELYLSGDGKERRIMSGRDTLVRSLCRVSTLRKGDFIDFTGAGEPYRRSVPVPAPEGKPVCPLCEGDRIGEIYQPVAVRKLAGGTLYDFGINHTGGLKLTVEAREGDELVVRYAEVLNERGEPNYETSAWHGKDCRDGKSYDIYQVNRYILKEGSNEIRPMFSWRCYRYVLMEGPLTIRVRKIQSLFIHMDLKQNGHFDCSNRELTRINEMFLQTLRCNLHSGLVTDCPHREKLPYTGDEHIIMKSACYNLDAVSFYYKWFEDLLDAQTWEGLIPNTAPNLGGGGGYAWGNAICYVTRYLYSFTGDRVVARRGYEAILRWISYYRSKEDENHIIYQNSHQWMLGDWLAPDTVASDVYYISTACYLIAVDTAIFLAELLDLEQKRELTELKEEIRRGIHRVFFHPQSLSYGNGVQGEDVLALALEIVPHEYRDELRRKVEHHYTEETEGHLDTGIILTPILIGYLTDQGYTGLAYRMMTVRSYPSYHFLMEGDTTFSEHWSKRWPDYYVGDSGSRLVKGGGELSHCHPMYGSVAAWLYERIAGLDLTNLYRQILEIRPYFTDCLSWARADKIVPCGRVGVEWARREGMFFLRVEIPGGMTGRCCFPSPYEKLKSRETGEIFYRERDGFFRFSLSAGVWTLLTEKEED